MFKKLVPKKISEKQKRDMVNCFTCGETIDQLSEKYKITKATITRHLKSELDLKIFKSTLEKNKLNYEKSCEDLKKDLKPQSDIKNIISDEEPSATSKFYDPSFIEIAPLNFEIENQIQKDLSSVSISDIELPKIVYMIVNHKIELETKILKDYPDWQFLSQKELTRKTIEIFFDIKIAKRFCIKEQKVLKVPNTGVFKIVAPLLVSRGISRIVCPDKLIAL